MNDLGGRTPDQHAAPAAPRPLPVCPWYARTWVRLTACFVLVATLPLVCTAIYVTHRHVAVIRHVAASASMGRVEQAAHRFEETLLAARTDLLALAEWPIWESYQAADNEHDRQFWLDKLGVQLRTFADLKPLYLALAYSDEAGHDLMRVVRRGTVTTLQRSDVSLDPVERAVLARTTELAARQTHWDFKVADGGMTLLCAARASSRRSQRRTAVWLELDGAAVLAACAPTDSQSSTLALFDDTGSLLLTHGSAAGPELRIGTLRQHVDAVGRLVSVSPVFAFSGQEQPQWRLGLFEAATILDAGVHDFRAAFLSLLGVAMLLATLLSAWLARQFSQPLRRLYQASCRIGCGDFDVHLSDNMGDEIGALALQVDVMARQLRASHQDFERLLSDKTEQLVHAERLSTIGRTAAAVAHEINNPTGIISLYAQMVSERLPSGDPNIEKLAVIRNKAREISSIVGELLDYSRKPAPYKEWVDCRTLISRALQEAQALQADGAAAPQIHVTLTVDEDAATLFADPQHMGRVLRNLINNARHAMVSGGTLCLRSRRQNKGGVTIEVGDTGTGMNADQLRHLFDPFYTTKRFGAGTGLGLAISKEITERHGGRISVQSEVGSGTTVTLWIPDPAGEYDI